VSCGGETRPTGHREGGVDREIPVEYFKIRVSALIK
jgi:hypothetical protein